MSGVLWAENKPSFAHSGNQSRLINENNLRVLGSKLDIVRTPCFMLQCDDLTFTRTPI